MLRPVDACLLLLRSDTEADRLVQHESDHQGQHQTEEQHAEPTYGLTPELIDTSAVEKVTELVADAVDAGAEVLTGGSAIEGPGYFYPPTVLGGVLPSARVNREEIFGPVAPIVPFNTDDEAIALANDTEFGLVAYAFTESLTRALTVAEQLETGMVGINQGIVSNPAAPFGGVKASGLGREGGPEGIEEYLETKYVGIRL